MPALKKSKIKKLPAAAVQNFLFSAAAGFYFSSSGLPEEDALFSDTVFEITGYTPDEIISFPARLMAIVHESDKDKVNNELFLFIKGQSASAVPAPFRIVKKDGSVIWTEIKLYAERDADNAAVNLFGLVTDITENHNNIEYLKARIERLNAANASKDKFISMLSHDLRAPFTSILGFAEILINEPALPANEKLEYLNYIHDSSQNQLQLINYLLDWSRLQTGRIKLEPQRLNALSIVYNCISSLTGNAIRKNIDIKVDIEENIYVQADERLLTQAIINILSNAIKFSPEDKSIEIRAALFNSDRVELIIKDHGVGIPDSARRRLFDISEIFSSEGTKGEKGTGLGLSLVKEIIDKHNGEIWFYSEPGEGSEFHFTVPASHNLILLVDDSYSDRLYYEKLIRQNIPGYSVASAGNGFEAIEIMMQKVPSLIVTDHEMPLMSGMQLLEYVRKEDKYYSIPVICIVSYLEDEQKRKYQSLGIHSLLKKPVDASAFAEHIRAALT